VEPCVAAGDNPTLPYPKPLATPGGARAQVLKEEILPALERLRREKGQFLEWQAAGASIERLRRFCVAYRLASTERCAPRRPWLCRLPRRAPPGGCWVARSVLARAGAGGVRAVSRSARAALRQLASTQRASHSWTQQLRRGHMLLTIYLPKSRRTGIRHRQPPRVADHTCAPARPPLRAKQCQQADMPTRGAPRPRRHQADRQAEVDAGQARLAELGAGAAEAEAEAAEKDDQLAALATEKELQAGGEVKELAARADELAKQCAPYPTPIEGITSSN
jgi:hypothetical protein